MRYSVSGIVEQVVQNLFDLDRVAANIAEQAFENPQINSNPGSLSLNQPMIEIKPRWDRVTELGLSSGELRYAISALSDGAYVDEFILYLVEHRKKVFRNYDTSRGNLRTYIY